MTSGKRGSYQPRAKLNLGNKFYNKAMKGYERITCPLGERGRAQAQADCWTICGLTCAKGCFRAPDGICDGCPCYKDEGGENE